MISFICMKRLDAYFAYLRVTSAIGNPMPNIWMSKPGIKTRSGYDGFAGKAESGMTTKFMKR